MTTKSTINDTLDLNTMLITSAVTRSYIQYIIKPIIQGLLLSYINDPKSQATFDLNLITDASQELNNNQHIYAGNYIE